MYLPCILQYTAITGSPPALRIYLMLIFMACAVLIYISSDAFLIKKKTNFKKPKFQIPNQELKISDISSGLRCNYELLMLCMLTCFALTVHFVNICFNHLIPNLKDAKNKV